MPSFKNIYCEDTGESAKDYEAYLQTRHWRALRQKIIQRYGGECQRCHDIVGEAGHVHHKTYKRLGREKIDDLTLYCNKCHKTIHKARVSDRDICAQITALTHQMNSTDRKKVLEYAEKIFGPCDGTPISNSKAKAHPTKYYAVRKGRKSNVIVNTWSKARRLVEHVSGAQYHSFSTLQEARAYLAGKDGNRETASFGKLSQMEKERT